MQSCNDCEGRCDRVAALRQFLPDFHGLSRFAEEVINLGVGDTGGEDDD